MFNYMYMFRRADLEGVDSGWLATLPPIFGKAKKIEILL